MSDMKISIGFRWKSGVHSIIDTLCQILINNLLNKISGNSFFCFSFGGHIFFQFFFAHSCPIP